ncbi:hypothetical protein ABT173_45665, partial [Streptomyces sp. NPDC001795]
LQTAMASGVPAIGIPLHLERDLNVALLERLGAARCLAPRRVGPPLATLAQQMLDGRPPCRQPGARAL